MSVKPGSPCPCREIPQPSIPVTRPCLYPSLPTPVSLASGPGLELVLWEPGRRGGAHQGRAHREGPRAQQEARRGKKSRSPEEAGQGRGGAGRVHPLLPAEMERAEAPLFPAILVSPHGAPHHCHRLEPKTSHRTPRPWGLGPVRGIPPALPPHLLGWDPAEGPSTHKLFLCTHWTSGNTRTIPETLVPGTRVLGPAHGPMPCPLCQMALGGCTRAATHKPRRSETPLLHPMRAQTRHRSSPPDPSPSAGDGFLGGPVEFHVWGFLSPSAGSWRQALVGAKHVVYKH